MEQWEHYVLEAGMFRGEPFLHGQAADGTVSSYRGGVQPADVLTVLNDLGSEGWQLVIVERETNDNGWTPSHWLKRRLA